MLLIWVWVGWKSRLSSTWPPLLFYLNWGAAPSPSMRSKGLFWLESRNWKWACLVQFNKTCLILFMLQNLFVIVDLKSSYSLILLRCSGAVVKYSSRTILFNHACCAVHHQPCHLRRPISDRLPERALPCFWCDLKSGVIFCSRL